MRVSLNVSYFVRTAILLYLIHSATSHDKNQSLNVTNGESPGIFRKDHKNITIRSLSSADKSLRKSPFHEINSTLAKYYPRNEDIHETKKLEVAKKIEKKALQEVILVEGNKNDSRKTGVVKRKKRCILAMMALGGVASAAGMFFRPRYRPKKIIWERQQYTRPRWTKRPCCQRPRPRPRPPPPPPPPPRPRPPPPPPPPRPRPPPPPPPPRPRPPPPPRTTRRPPAPPRTTRRPPPPPPTTRRPPPPPPTTRRPPPTTTRPTTTSSKMPPTVSISEGNIQMPFIPADVISGIKNVEYRPGQGEGMKRIRLGGSIVINGKPKYNITNAIYVTNTIPRILGTGIVILQFIHPLTKQTIYVPMNVGEDYVNPKTREVFVIFVDTRGRTLLIFKGYSRPRRDKYLSGDNFYIVNHNRNMILDNTKWGSYVIGGVPHYDILNATIVKEVKQKKNIHNVLVVEFLHPFTKKIVEVPVNGGDEFVNRKTREVFIIFVDTRGNTLLIFKGIDRTLPAQQGIVSEKRNVGTIVNWGHLVVNGVPKYNIDNAIKVTDGKIKIIKGMLVIEFAHPITLQTIQLPLNIGDEYVNPRTGEVFLIIVDNRGRTILIYKRYKKLVTPTKPENPGKAVIGGVPKPDISNALKIAETATKIRTDGTWVIVFLHPITKITTEVPLNGGDEYFDPKTKRLFIVFIDSGGRTLLIPKDKQPPFTITDPKSGSLVVEGIPKPDIPNAVIITKTEQIRGPDGVIFIVFLHPITKIEIRIPRNGGDEYVDPKTNQIFLIFVDSNGRTLLILKDKRSIAIIDPQWGSLVVRGVPKPDISNALIITETKQKIRTDGIAIIEFFHPISNIKIRVPRNGGDEYVDPNTNEIFIIFVDISGRTLLIRKDDASSSLTEPHKSIESIYDFNDNINVNNNTNINHIVYNKVQWGTMVIGGKPKYDIRNAIYITKIWKKMKNRILYLVFVHPITREVIGVPATGGDEYIDPKTKRIFLIIVDTKGRTILVPKQSDSPLGEPNNDSLPNNENRYPNWGSIVTNGVPNYDINRAIIVKNPKYKIIDGKLILEFLHPITGRIFRIPPNGGDEYVDPETNEIFVIFVDENHRTILILKGKSDSVTENSKWGSIVVNGVPNYDISHAIIVKNPKYKIKDGKLILEFLHPITGRIFQIPPNGGDEYVDPETNEIFVIFVDENHRTILILKGKSDSVTENSKWGSIVVNGVPNYDISHAIIVKNPKYKIKDGKLILEFLHPITGRMFRIPPNVGDEYVDPQTNEIFVIFVDENGRTILILKGKSNSGKFTNKWGSIVVNGVPKYDITTATIVMRVEKKITNDGIRILEFQHPMTREIIGVPLDGGDEYVNPETKQVFLIFVDINGRTILIFKGIDPSVVANDPLVVTSDPFDTTSDPLVVTSDPLDITSDPLDTASDPLDTTSNPTNEQKIHNKWGSVVIGGVPKYDISAALYVKETVRKIDGNGISMVEFIHPITRQTIQVPQDGGDEYFKPKTREIFIIFVDLKGRTLLIFKGFEPSTSADDPITSNPPMNNDPNNREPRENNNINTNVNSNVNQNILAAGGMRDDNSDAVDAMDN